MAVAPTETQARAAASTMVDNYAPGAPADVLAAAAAMVAQSILDTPYDDTVNFADQQTSTHNLGANIIRRCGASSILAPWRRPRARALEPAP